MCLLPPQCLFCCHYRENAGIDERDCDAFIEIPDDIFRSEFDHAEAHAGDGGVRFELNPEMSEEFDDVNELRTEMQLRQFARRAAA